MHLSQVHPSSSHPPVSETCGENEGKHPSNHRSAERNFFLRRQRGSHFSFSRPTAESGNLRTRQEGWAKKVVGENNAQPATPGAMNILPGGGGGCPLPTRHPYPALGRCRSAYLNDAAAPGGRSCSLQEAGLAIRGDPRSARQRDPAATVPHPATRDRGWGVPGGSVGAGSGVVFCPGSVERRRSLPASRALSHGQARSRLRARQHDRQQRPAPGTGALRHQEENPLDFVSARDGGCSGSRNFVERRHRSGRGVLGLWSRRSAGRRGPAAGAGRRCEREGEAGEKQREVRETRGERLLCADKRQRAPEPGASGAGTSAAAGAATADRPPATCPPTAARRPQEVLRRQRPPLRSPVTGREDLF